MPREFMPIQSSLLSHLKALLVFITAVICFTTPASILASPITDTAWKHIKSKDFKAAQNTLHQWLKSTPNDSEAQFLYARALAWDKKHDQAIVVLNKLIAKQPNNADFLLSKANVLSWQQNEKSAIKTLKIARNISPEYREIWELELKLLQKVGDNKQYQQVKNEYSLQFHTEYQDPKTKIPAAPKQKKYLLIGKTIERLDIKTDDWHTNKLEFGAKMEKHALNLSLENSSRFNLSDNQISTSLSRQFKKHIIVTTAFSISENNLLYPAWQSQLQAEKTINKKNVIEIKWQHKKYSADVIDGTSISFSQYLGNFLPRISINTTALNNNDFTLNYSGDLSWFFNKQDFIRLSISKGNDIEYLQQKIKTTETNFMGIDGRWQFNKNWNAILALGHHKQGTIYKKDGIFIGLQRRF